MRRMQPLSTSIETKGPGLSRQGHSSQCRFVRAALFSTLHMDKTRIGTDIVLAATLLKRKQIVAIPTETVYGLAANGFSGEAVRKVFELKHRPFDHPLIVHLDSIEKIKACVAAFPLAASALLQAFSPGPLTVLLPTNNLLPSLINSHRREMAFRIPSHPLTLALLKQLEVPLVAPSANLFAGISPTTPQHVLKHFDGKIPYILDGGPCRVGIESTVVGFDEEGHPVVFRHGAITEGEIKRVAGALGKLPVKHNKPSPGLSAKHYAPATPLQLIDSGGILPPVREGSRVGLLAFAGYHHLLPTEHQFVLSVEGDLLEAARNLYKGLHYLDDLGLDLLLAEKVPNIGAGIAINDRLQRAAHP